MNKYKSNSQIIFYQTEDGKTRLEVRLEDETVRLSQKMMAELFQVSIPTINEHIKSIYEDRELTTEATVKECVTVQTEGTRQVSRQVDF